jgi:oxygen-dependent protoporphyrinogen oxidase
LVAGIYTADPEKLSMAATMPQFLDDERQHGSLLRATRRRHTKPRRTGHFSDQVNSAADSNATEHASGPRYGLFVAPTEGMTSFVNALSAQLPTGTIQLNSSVTSISRGSDNRWRINLSLPPGEARGEGLFDAVILSLPAHAAARVVERVDPQLAAELHSIPYADCAVVSTGFARRQVGHALDAFGFVVPQCEGRRIIAASFASLKYPGRAPGDCVLIRTFIGGALQPELMQLSDAELAGLALKELSALLTVRGEPLVTDIVRWPASMPQYHVGHLERVARIEQLISRWPGLALAGNAYHGVGIPQCIASGQSAAERIATI